MKKTLKLLKTRHKRIPYTFDAKFIILALLSCELLLQSCDDLIEPDLSEATIQLVSPSDNLQTSSNAQIFVWEAIKFKGNDSTKFFSVIYHLQIAKPSFSEAFQLVVDSNLTIRTFTKSLPKGKYEWRVRAENGSSETAYFSRKLQIDSTSALTSNFFLKGEGSK